MRRKITLYIIVLLLIPFFIASSLLNRPFEEKLRDRLAKSAQDAIALSAVEIENLIERMLNCVTSITMNRTLVNILRAPGAYSAYETATEIRSIISAASNTYFRDGNNEITILNNSGEIFTNWTYDRDDPQRLRQEAWYADCMKSNGEFIWHFGTTNHSHIPNTYRVSVCRLIDEFKFSARYGMACASVGVEQVQKYLESTSFYPEEVSILLDGEGRIIFHTDSRMNTLSAVDQPYYQAAREARGYAVREIDGREYFVCYRTLERFGWKIVRVVPYDIFISDIAAMNTAATLWKSAILLLFTVISVCIASYVTKPLNRLRDRMRRLGQKDFAAPPEMGDTRRGAAKRADEIATLEAAYEEMLGHMARLVQDVREEQTLRERTYNRFLQAQINAHFILNTVNNIKISAYMVQANAIGDMLASLGVILENSLGKGDTTVALEEEIRYVENYIRLRRIGSTAALTCDIDVPPALGDARVMKLLLQPIVENSFQHGLNAGTQNGVIAIEARCDRADLYISVRDDGNGMEPRALESVRREIAKKDYSEIPRSLGLKNINDRIAVTCGPGYGLTIQSALGRGTTVTLKLPLIRGAREAAL